MSLDPPTTFHVPYIETIQCILLTRFPSNLQINTCLLLTDLSSLIFQYDLETKRLERDPIADKMLAHRLDPMQPQTVQHGARTLHDDQDGYREYKPEVE